MNTYAQKYLWIIRFSFMYIFVASQTEIMSRAIAVVFLCP